MQAHEILPGYKHGVFVSYSHVDREWVDLFVDKLRASLKRLLGVEEKGLVWKDERLEAGDNLDDEIVRAIGDSALFLIVLSPGWINSRYCPKELAQFEGAVRDPGRQRVFIVEALPCGPKLPADVARYYANHVRVKFYKGGADDSQLVVFDNPSRKPFAEALSTIACALRNKLQAFQQDGAADEGEQLPPVLLAEVADDIEEERSEVRSYLEGEGVTVLPSGSYFGRLESFERAFGTDLERAALLVQLLGRYAGRPVPRAEEPLVLLQHRLARDYGLPMLHWRPGNLDPAQLPAGDLRSLLEAATVRSGTLESFKREVLQRLHRLRDADAPVQEVLAPVVAPTVPPKAGGMPFVFVNADRRDWPVAEFLRDELAQHVYADTPLDIDDPGQIDQDRSQKFRECDAMVLVYGASPNSWVTGQLRQFAKFAAPGRSPKPLWIFEAPPEQKPPITARAPNLAYETIGSRSELSSEPIAKIIERLHV